MQKPIAEVRTSARAVMRTTMSPAKKETQQAGMRLPYWTSRTAVPSLKRPRLVGQKLQRIPCSFRKAFGPRIDSVSTRSRDRRTIRMGNERIPCRSLWLLFAHFDILETKRDSELQLVADRRDFWWFARLGRTRKDLSGQFRQSRPRSAGMLDGTFGRCGWSR